MAAGRIGAADVFKSGVFDLCGLLVAHLLAAHFPKADGPSLISLLQTKFFDCYGDQNSGKNVILIPEVNRRIKTNTMRQVEAYANVVYSTILSAFPVDQPVDRRAFLVIEEPFSGDNVARPLTYQGALKMQNAFQKAIAQLEVHPLRSRLVHVI